MGTSCCGPKEEAPEQKPCASGCCGSSPTAPVESPVDDCGQSDTDSCCGSKTEDTPTDKGCCGGSKPSCGDKPPAVQSCKDQCCSSDKPREDKPVTSPETCQKGCCSDKPREAKPVITSEACQKGCCSDKPRVDKPVVSPEACKKGCCSSKDVEPVKPAEPAVPEGKCADKCCSSKKAEPVKPPVPEDKCMDKCCSSQEEDPAPPCCEGKNKPCCDSTCIERIVSREHPSIDEQGDSASSLRNKRAKCRQRYTEKLAALGCICRALIALGQESCCATKEKTSIERRRSKKNTSGCCSSGPSQSPCSARPKSPIKARSCSSQAQKPACQKGCCGNGKRPPSETIVAKDNSSVKSATVSHESSDNIADPERGLSGKEHVVLSITGMTCTGCETKLRRILGSVPAVTDLKTSLVMSRTEFNLDLANMSVESIVKHLEKTTEFKFERIVTKGSSIEVLPLGDIQAFLDQPLPLGVDSFQLVGKDTVRINFDPQAIGPRDLVEQIFQQECKLAPPSGDPGLAAGSKHVRSVGLMTLLSCILTIPVLVLAWAPLPEREIEYGAASLALATIIQVVIAGPFYPKALKALVFSRVIEMDLLIVLSTSAAYIFSVISFAYLVRGQPLSTGEFFETSTLLVSLIMVGRWVAALARQKAVESISMQSLQASTAQLATEDGEIIREIDARLLQYGDIFTVLPETKIPTDGIVIGGVSEVDESMLTGESRPVEKNIHDQVIAGSINGSGKLVVKLTYLPCENTISTIAGMVDDAKLSKPQIQDVADRVASYFVPMVVALTIITFVAWVGVGVGVRKQSGSEACVQAITFAITVLIVSCPCAVGLAVPMVIVIAGGVAADYGIIFKSAEAIEMAFRTTDVVFDKTGTLTEGNLKVVEEVYDEACEDPSVIRSKVLGLVANSKHPVSAAVAIHLQEQGIASSSVQDVKTVPGKGLTAILNGSTISGGNDRWLEVGHDSRVAAVLAKGYTVFCVTVDSKLYAVFGLSDTVRSDAAEAVSELKKKGVQVSMLSGDDEGAVQEIARKLNLDPENVKSRCSPGDKQLYIQKLLSTPAGDKKRVVVFVGDGTNDAVALTQATIGVHMNSGTDIAKSAADVVLMRPSIKSIVTMVDISRASVLRIAFNFGWSFIYNVLAVLLASGALISARSGASVRIPPEFAGLGELVSVLPVIAIAVGLKWAKF
ncbi:copper-translocating P-type ATPase [Camillea tinctor]|nr:copper-translocating P-type ATPase [Camillea tinctor]